jgi:uncharacterized membrane protein
MQSGIDIFVLISGSFSILATVPLIYLAMRSVRDAREVRRVQLEVADLVEEVHDIQREIHLDQRTAKSELLETKENVERVVRATERRRLPRVRLEFNRSGADS